MRTQKAVFENRIPIYQVAITPYDPNHIAVVTLPTSSSLSLYLLRFLPSPSLPTWTRTTTPRENRENPENNKSGEKTTTTNKNAQVCYHALQFGVLPEEEGEEGEEEEEEGSGSGRGNSRRSGGEVLYAAGADEDGKSAVDVFRCFDVE
jgi:hypothetical protein